MSDRSHIPGIILCCLELIAVAAACYGYLAEQTGTAYTGGALLVIISGVLILGATIVTEFYPQLQPGLRVTLDVLLFLGFAGTIFAAWLLMNWVLLAAMALAFLGWLVWRFAFGFERRVPHAAG